jgi:outer membrane protein TolC
MMNLKLLYRDLQVLSKLSFIILIILAIFSKLLIAQHNLDYYLGEAFKNNPALNEYENLIKMRELDNLLVDAEYIYPKVSLTSSFLFSPYFNNNGKLISISPEEQAIGYDVGITNGGLYSVLINVEKNIFNGYTVDAYNNQADLQIKTEENNIEILKHNLTRDITEQYLNAHQYQELYLLAKNIADTLQQQLKISEILVKNGFIKQSDYLLLKIEVDNQKISFRQYFNSYRSNLLELFLLCGLKDITIVALEKIELLPAERQSNSKFLQQFKTDSMLTINQQEIFETKYQPQLNLFFNTGLNAIELNNIQRKFGLSAGLNFSLPLFDGNQKDLTRQQSQISLNSIHSYKETQKVQILNKIKNAEYQLNSLKENLESIRVQISNYLQVIRMTERELIQGQESMIEYLTIIKNYFELKKNEVNTESDIQRSTNQLNYWNW